MTGEKPRLKHRTWARLHDIMLCYLDYKTIPQQLTNLQMWFNERIGV